MSPTDARDRSSRLAPTQPAQALVIARTIADPWFRCQALAGVGRYWLDKTYYRILEEAVAAGNSSADPYRQVAAAAWPIRAYLERGDEARARTCLVGSLRNAGGIDNMASRSEAIFLLLQSSKPFAPALWRPVFQALIDALEPARSWRQSRNVRLAIAMIASDAPDLAEQAMRKLSDKDRSTIRRDLARSGNSQAAPRSFFWAAGVQPRSMPVSFSLVTG